MTLALHVLRPARKVPRPLPAPHPVNRDSTPVPSWATRSGPLLIPCDRALVRSRHTGPSKLALDARSQRLARPARPSPRLGPPPEAPLTPPSPPAPTCHSRRTSQCANRIGPIGLTHCFSVSASD